MKKIIICRGLPGSGKTTWAKEMLIKYPEQFKRISKDDLRNMLDGGQWSKTNEQFVLRARDMLIDSALEEGFSVIVDDTNFDPKHERRIREFVEYGYLPGEVEIEIQLFYTPLEECIKRDQDRTSPVGEDVIRRMHDKYLM